MRTVYQAVSGRPDGVPAMVGAIQSFGDLIHWHPHIHTLVSEGVFLPDDTFLPLPRLSGEPFLKLWEQEVFKLLLVAGKKRLLASTPRTAKRPASESPNCSTPTPQPWSSVPGQAGRCMMNMAEPPAPERFP